MRDSPQQEQRATLEIRNKLGLHARAAKLIVETVTTYDADIKIADAVLDALIAQDPDSRVACESLIKTGLVVVAGEITSQGKVEFGEIAKQVIRDIGYTSADTGFNCDSCTIVTAIEKQSPDISQGVTAGAGLYNKEQGAGDQGIMFGYACDETKEYMPFAFYTAHRLIQRQG